jgi:hypothetical protein
VPDPTYIVRFGWTPRDVILLPGCLIFVIVGTLVFADSPLLGALGILLGAGYIVMTMVAWLSRRVALAVTAEGITFGVLPLSPAARSAFVPWSDVEAVVLWRQRVWRPGLWRGSVYYVGVVRRADAPPLPGSARNPTLRKINKALVPAELSEDLVADSRSITFWRLDKTRLTAAVGHFSPDVAVLDRT